MHHHHHHHHFNRAFAWAVLLNVVYVVLEVGFARHADAYSLLADAVHNFADISGLLLAWLAHSLLHRASNRDYSYGYKKLSIVASLLNGVLLLLSVLYIAFEALERMAAPTEVHTVTVMAVSFLGMLVNGGTALLFWHGHDDLNIRGAFLHLAADAAVSLGVLLAAALQWLTAWQRIDPTMSLIIVVLICWSSWGLVRDSGRMLLAAVPKHIDSEAVRRYLEELPGVESVHDLHIWDLSTQEVALTAHLVMPKSALSDHILRQINQELRQRFAIVHVTLQVERDTETNPCGQLDHC